MTLSGAENALITQIKTNLDAQFKSQPPPQNMDEGLQRLANAIGQAVIDILNTSLEVDLPDPGVTAYPTTATFKWKP